MVDPTVTTAEYADYKTAIKETWVPDFVDWVLAETEQWVKAQVAAGNDAVREILDMDTTPIRNQIIDDDIEKFENNDATIIGVIDDGSFVGGVYLDILNSSKSKLNRLWLPERYRGHGLGKALVERAIQIAADAGVDIIQLSTAPFMDTAQSIYREFGFDYCAEPFPSTTVPESLIEYWNFMELEL